MGSEIVLEVDDKALEMLFSLSLSGQPAKPSPEQVFEP
jgi:hypothetical protein